MKDQMFVVSNLGEREFEEWGGGLTTTLSTITVPLKVCESFSSCS